MWFEGILYNIRGTWLLITGWMCCSVLMIGDLEVGILPSRSLNFCEPSHLLLWSSRKVKQMVLVPCGVKKKVHPICWGRCTAMKASTVSGNQQSPIYYQVNQRSSFSLFGQVEWRNFGIWWHVTSDMQRRCSAWLYSFVPTMPLLSTTLTFKCSQFRGPSRLFSNLIGMPSAST